MPPPDCRSPQNSESHSTNHDHVSPHGTAHGRDDIPPALHLDPAPDPSDPDPFPPSLHNPEAHAHAQGHTDGTADGTAQGRAEARAMGFAHGFAALRELGEWSGRAAVWAARCGAAEAETARRRARLVRRVREAADVDLAPGSWVLGNGEGAAEEVVRRRRVAGAVGRVVARGFGEGSEGAERGGEGEMEDLGGRGGREGR